MRRGEIKALLHCLQSPILLIYFKVCKSVLLTIGTVLYNRSLLTYSSYITETAYPLRKFPIYPSPPIPQNHHSILYFYEVDYFYMEIAMYLSTNVHISHILTGFCEKNLNYILNVFLYNFFPL